MAHLDKDEFEAVAALVMKYNKYCKYDSIDSLVEYMISFAYRNLPSDKPYGYAGTGGFYICSFDYAETGETGYKPFLMTSLIPV